MKERPRLLVSWSSGKDAAFMLHRLQQQNEEYEIAGLVTTLNAEAGRVAMHAVREELLTAQADALGLPLWPVRLPWPCSDAKYEAQMRKLIDRAREIGVTHFAFGDLFLPDIRAYRERMLAGTGIEPVFPLFGSDTPSLAREILDRGFQAVITCVDSRHAPTEWAGRPWDQSLLDSAPPDVDPCGENGEFHTFCWNGPIFDRPIPVRPGVVIESEGFVFVDLEPACR